jgi:hypothetical protein
VETVSLDNRGTTAKCEEILSASNVEARHLGDDNRGSIRERKSEVDKLRQLSK